ncbi:prophage tail fiber N-terminal domain-containing protein [Serratia fonticola]|uniref:phage tail fiber protein n=3 Tax=Serratia fonticola TaxID=47917 RepID=UPI003AADF54D
MAVISDVLRGPYGDIQPNVIITMQAKGTTARVLTSNRSSTVTDVDGNYSMTVFPGEYEVTVSTLGHVGDIRVLTDSVNGTLNDFLISPPKPDELTPEVVRTVDTMRAESAASAAAAKTSETNAAAAMANALSKTVTAAQAVAGVVTFNKGSVSVGAVDSKASSPTNNPAMRFMTDANIEKVAIIAEQDPVGIQIRWSGKAQSALFYNDGTVRFPGTVQSGTTPLLKAGEYGIGGAALPYSGSIDDVTIATGMYLALSSSTGTKPPGSPTGHLTVSREGATGTTVNQKWVANNDDTLYIRRFYPGGWSTWKKSWDDGNMPNPIKVGDYGLGGSTPVTYADLTNAGQNMFFRIPANTVGSASAAAQGGIMGGYDSGARWQLSWDQGVSAPVLTTRVRNGSTGVWSPFSTLWHSTNTTVDANGFLKKASPIVKLFGTGESELNDECQGVTTERLSEGVYRVSGVLGFNGDGAWGGAGNGIEIPVDDNKRPLIWVESKVLPDGDIEIRTYHRTYATGPYSARNIEAMDSGEVGKKKQPIFVEMPDGTPIDIPAGRWIDLRVEMPASDETELAPEEETTPELEQPAVTEPAPEITNPEAEQGQEPEQTTMTGLEQGEESNTEQNDGSKA